MGMKVKQDSKVKTFFKRLFKISRKKGVDGSWKQLDKDALYRLSQQAGLDITVSSDGDLDIFEQNQQKGESELVKPVEIINVEITNINHHDEVDGSRKTPKNKKRKVKKDQNKLLIDSNDSDIEAINVTKTKTKKRDKNKKNKQSKNVELFRKSLSVDQELIDVDFDLVLSSFPNLNKSQDQNEDDQNRKNEQIHQDERNKGNICQVDVVIENRWASEGNQNRSLDKGSQVQGQNEPKSGYEGFEKRAEVFEQLVIQNEHVDESPSKPKSKKKKQTKSQLLEQEETTDLEKLDDVDNTIWTIDSQTLNVDQSQKKEKKKKRKNKKKEPSFEAEPYEGSTEMFVSTEPLVNKKTPKSPKNQNQKRVSKKLNDKYAKLESELDEVDVLEPVPEEVKSKKKNKKNKKRGNVRRPEDDLEDDLQELPVRRPKHQVLWDDSITEQETPEIERRPIGGKKKKKFRRRLLKLKLNSEKKLDVKRYDELSNKDGDEEKKGSTSGVGRRMWRACKSGWRYLKAGLIFYSKSPASSLTMTPMAQRYAGDTEVNPFSMT